LAKPSIIEARKAAAMETLAERLSAIENFLTGGNPPTPGVLTASEVAPVGPMLDALRDAIVDVVRVEVRSAKQGTAELIADALAPVKAKLDELAERLVAMAAAQPADKVWPAPAAKPAKNS